MLPNASGLEEILFPMTASVFYSVISQSEYGNIIKTWVVDREIKCSMISEMSTRSFAGELKTKGTDFIYDSNAFLRTSEDIRKQILPSGQVKYHPITGITIAGAKDPNGQLVWINGFDTKKFDGPLSTKYEIKTIVPTFDYNHNLRHWRVYLSKAQIQGWGE